MNSKLDLRLESAKLAVMVDGITPEMLYPYLRKLRNT